MTKIFKIQDKELKQYEKMLGLGPARFRRVVANVLNKQAAAMKFQHIPAALQNAFTIRDKKFMNRQIRFNKAKVSKDPDVNFSEAGSVEIAGSGKKGPFTGWGEQQEGKAPEKKRQATLDARKGSFGKKMTRASRLRESNTFRRPTDYPGRSKKERVFRMLKETQASKLNFIIKNGEGNVLDSNLPDGVYGWKGKKLRMLQSFKDPKVHKADWRGDAIKRLFKKRGTFDHFFDREMRKLFKEF